MAALPCWARLADPEPGPDPWPGPEPYPGPATGYRIRLPATGTGP
jgi:hypothetical protein